MGLPLRVLALRSGIVLTQPCASSSVPVIAACGATDVWGLQVRAALHNGELTPEELRETLVILAPYAGYPRVAPLVGVCEETINEWGEVSGGREGPQEA